MDRIRYPTIFGLFLCFIAILTPLCFGDDSSHRELASLAEKWNITGPLDFNYTSLVFSLTYQVSDFILDGMVKEVLYDKDCAEGGNVVGSVFLSSQATPDASVPPGSGDAIREVLVTITMDPETISQSNIYSEEVVNNQMVATVRFCHRFMLFTTSDTPIEVNFLETLVTLTVDLTDGFDIGIIDVQDKDKLIQTANQAYQVEGYQCDYTNTPLTELELAKSRAQGTVVRVCVRPEMEARSEGVFMRSIDSFVFERDYGGSIGSVTQVGVANGAKADNLMTELYCSSGNSVCVFETILMAIFFRLPGTVDGTGIASMQFGDQELTRRRLRGDSGDRILQQQGVAAISEFDLSMELIPRAQPRGRSDGRRSRGNSFLLSIVFAVLLVLRML
jgi:hypothetical protein